MKNTEDWNPDAMDSNELSESWDKMAKSMRSGEHGYTPEPGENTKLVAEDEEFEKHLRELYEKRGKKARRGSLNVEGKVDAGADDIKKEA